jgi:hypothetical protein
VDPVLSAKLNVPLPVTALVTSRSIHVPVATFVLLAKAVAAGVGRFAHVRPSSVHVVSETANTSGPSTDPLDAYIRNVALVTGLERPLILNFR